MTQSSYNTGNMDLNSILKDSRNRNWLFSAVAIWIIGRMLIKSVLAQIDCLADLSVTDSAAIADAERQIEQIQNVPGMVAWCRLRDREERRLLTGNGDVPLLGP